MIQKEFAIFTPGPVKMSREILDIGAMQTPYFRNQSFSDVLLYCEKQLLDMLNAPKNSRVVFLTASGTAGMESVVMNLLTEKNHAIVINGGGFGQRFVDICDSYDIPHQNYIATNTNLQEIDTRLDGTASDTFIVNAHETSVGHIYDLEAIGKFCQKNKLLNIVDAISAFVTDRVDMQKHHIDCAIVSSQKGLALPPGLTMIAMSPKAIDKINKVRSHYFNFENYLKDGARGQTPYTPCVGIILQLEHRLKQIQNDGGIKATIKKAKTMANYFRDNIKHLPLLAYTKFMPNAMTTLTPTDGKSAFDIVCALEQDYKVIVCPNGGETKHKVFRVSHMGDTDHTHIDKLIDALNKLYEV